MTWPTACAAVGAWSGLRTRKRAIVASKDARCSVASIENDSPRRRASANNASSTSVTLRAMVTVWPCQRSTRSAVSAQM